ncbi:MAG: hypothetical protein ACP5KU_07820 [Candidatus Bathyarchaeia archaeon]
MLSLVHLVLADTYTRYPPYDLGFSGGNSSGVGFQDYRHNIFLLNGTARLYSSVWSDLVGGALAEAWGFMGVEWTAPYSGGDGGGCPFVSTWNGTHYVLDNNLLPQSELNNGTDVDDYYRLEQPLVTKNGKYALLISEFESEHSFLDYVELITVDHPIDAEVGVSPYGEILTYKNPCPPVSAITSENKNVKVLLNSIDGNYYEGCNGSWIMLNFGDDLDVSQGCKLVIRSDMFAVKTSIHIQVQDKDGQWNDVASFIPRSYWSTDIIDMSKFLPDAKGKLKVRLYFTASHKVDFVGLDVSPQATINVQKAELVSAIHSKDGDITTKLLYLDSVYAELLPAKQIELMFNPTVDINGERTLVLHTRGHYVKTLENDLIVTVQSKVTLKGYAYAFAWSFTPAIGARCQYKFQVWLWVYDVTGGSYVTQTLLEERSEEVASAAYIPVWTSYEWNYDKDYSATFNAVEGHKYQIEFGVYVGVKGATIGGSFDGYVDFDSSNRYIVIQYIHLSW